MRKFGEWIVTEGWQDIKENMSPTEQTAVFEKILNEKLDLFCPEKTMKVSSQDKPWINGELKAIARQKNREYNKRGKSATYKKLAKKFEEKYKY